MKDPVFLSSLIYSHLISTNISLSLDDKDKTYYTALSKQTYSYKELLVIAAKTISFMVQAEQKSEHKVPSSPIKNTPDKLSSVLNNRTLRDITNLFDPYKRHLLKHPSSHSHIYCTAMTEHTNSYKHLI